MPTENLEAPATSLVSSYRIPNQGYDEAFQLSGLPRAHWSSFLRSLDAIGWAELSRRHEESTRQLKENGITYHPVGDLTAVTRPWELDPIPLLIDGNSWNQLSQGLKQRARLLNLILADLYGKQRLLSRGLIPPQLVFAHPGFQRAYHQQQQDERYLYFYSADITRTENGQWRVLGDRTEAPSGAGYALENRIAISRMLPNLIHDCQVSRLASYFLAVRETLQRLAPRYRDNPRVVLLSQGAHRTSYLEDAYLARYLGYSLVEGGDLAVRNNRVLLKTLAGLLPVEVILRRVDAVDCDPLELRGDSTLGVIGLLQAIRSNNVVVANSLGSGILESPVFLPYLPKLCRALLSEDLLLSSVDTWWCGEPESLAYVLEHLPELEIRSAFRQGNQEVWFGDELSGKRIDDVRAQLVSNPAQYIAQALTTPSSIPVWGSQSLEPWRMMLRTYLVASQDSYVVMPGGLTRTSPQGKRLGLSIAEGERAKDTWILTDTPVEAVSLLQPAGQLLELRRSGAELPSRVADNLYWLGRQVERIEGAARLLRTVLLRLTSEVDSNSIPELPVLLRSLAELGHIEPGFAIQGMKDPMPAIERALPDSIFDEEEVTSLRAMIVSAHRATSLVRDRISLDSWRIIQELEQKFRKPTRGGDSLLSDILALLNDLVLDLASFSGMVMESMTRTQGWRFLDIGRRLERALYTLNLVRNAVVVIGEKESVVLDAILEVADSSMTYRTRYLANFQVAPVIDLLLTDETNPRSVAFQLAVLSDHIENLPRERNQPLRHLEQRLIMSALHSVRMADVVVLSEMHKDGERTYLDRLLSRISTMLPTLSDAISHRYLIHAGSPRQLTRLRTQGKE
ncbi:MAG: circularly permuted type 2 ATP-grasp protein [Planctomycetaceae bacterium]